MEKETGSISLIKALSQKAVEESIAPKHSHPAEKSVKANQGYHDTRNLTKKGNNRPFPNRRPPIEKDDGITK